MTDCARGAPELEMLNELTFLVFDDWWTGTYVFRLNGLLAQEIDALVSYHWRELQAVAKKRSERRLKEREG